MTITTGVRKIISYVLTLNTVEIKKLRTPFSIIMYIYLPCRRSTIIMVTQAVPPRIHKMGDFLLHIFGN